MLPTVYGLWFAKVTGKDPPPHVAAFSGASDLGAILDDYAPPERVPDVGDDSAADVAHPAPNVPAGDDDKEPTDPQDRAKMRNAAMNFVQVPSLSSMFTGI